MSCTERQVSSTSLLVMPWWTKRLSGPIALGEPGQEGDDVVAGLALDRVDAVEVGWRDVGDAGAAARRGWCAAASAGIGAECGHGLGGQRLDLEPDAEAVLGRPDGGHLGAGVAGNHRVPLPLTSEWPCAAHARHAAHR